MRILTVWAASQLLYQFSSRRSAGPFTRIAHRGAAAHAPENTLEACRHGIRLQADYLEIDLRLTLDGQLVLMHDSSLRRTTGRPGRVEQLKQDQLGDVPSFDQFLQLARAHPAIGIFPEIKGRSPGIEAAIVASIRKYSMEERTIIPSFSGAALRRVHELAPAIPLCHLYYPWEFALKSLPPGVTIIAPMAEGLLLSPWIVRQAQRRGLKVWPWFAGLENRWTVRFLLSLGVDGLILDDPTSRRSLAHP